MSATRRCPARFATVTPSSLTLMDQHVHDAAEPTGMAAADEVVRRVSNLTDRPVADHVEVFELAHEQLRRALDAVADPLPEPGQGA